MGKFILIEEEKEDDLVKRMNGVLIGWEYVNVEYVSLEYKSNKYLLRCKNDIEKH